MGMFPSINGKKVKTGTAQALDHQEVYVNVGFRPKYISLYGTITQWGHTRCGACVYNADCEANKQIRVLIEDDTTSYSNHMAIETSGMAFTLKSIDDTGFTINSSSNDYYATAFYYTAIG